MRSILTIQRSIRTILRPRNSQTLIKELWSILASFWPIYIICINETYSHSNFIYTLNNVKFYPNLSNPCLCYFSEKKVTQKYTSHFASIQAKYWTFCKKPCVTFQKKSNTSKRQQTTISLCFTSFLEIKNMVIIP